MIAPTGVLLVNLGTPDAPEAAAVRRYLAEFLSDPRVLDLHPIARWLLLRVVILPLRPKRSAHAYAKIWTDDGSPLLVHGRALTDAVARARPELQVRLAMRYGSPSIAEGLSALRAAGCEDVVVLPLYPQYAASTTASSLDAVYEQARGTWDAPRLRVVPPFFDDAGFVAAFTAVARPVLDELAPDHVVMSFHGLPVRHLHKSDPSGTVCLASAACCDAVGPDNRRCYRAHCFATARALTAALDLPAERVTVAFQSRLGRDPWIEPYTDATIRGLAERGAKRVAVLCPAFVADCLETLEEIGIGAQQAFVAAGGERLVLVPSLNAHPRWVQAVVAMLDRATG